MQSTGHTATQLASLTLMHGSVITYVMRSFSVSSVSPWCVTRDGRGGARRRRAPPSLCGCLRALLRLVRALLHVAGLSPALGLAGVGGRLGARRCAWRTGRALLRLAGPVLARAAPRAAEAQVAAQGHDPLADGAAAGGREEGSHAADQKAVEQPAHAAALLPGDSLLGGFPGLLRALRQERFGLLERLLRLALCCLNTFLQHLRERRQRIFGQVDDV